MWPRLLRDEDPGLLPTALAMEGVLIELIFVAGPLLTALLSALIDPAAALVLSPVLLLVGLAGFLMQPPVRTWVISEDAGSHGALGALRSPGIQTLVLCTLPMGFCFGAMEVTLPAFSEDHGARGLAGVLVAVWSLGSAAGGLLYGAWHWSGPAGRRYARLAALLPLGYLPLALAPSMGVMYVLALLAGLCIAPTLTAGNQIAGDVAPSGAETEAYTWPITAAGGRAGDRQLVGGRDRRGRRLAGRVPGLGRWRGAQRAAGRGALADAAAAARATKPSCSGRRPWPTRAGARRGRRRRRCGAGRGGARPARARSPSSSPHSAQRPSASSGSPGRTIRPGSQCSALDDPRHDVLQTAEDRLVLVLGLGHAEAVVRVDRRATPGAVLGHRWLESSRAGGGPRNGYLPGRGHRTADDHHSRGRRDRPGAARPGAPRARPRGRRAAESSSTATTSRSSKRRETGNADRRGRRGRDAQAGPRASRPRRSRPRARTTSARPTGSCARASTARSSSAPAGASRGSRRSPASTSRSRSSAWPSTTPTAPSSGARAPRAAPTRSPTGPRRSRARPAARSPSTPSGPPQRMGGKVYGGPKWTVSPVYEGMLKEEMDAAAARHPDVWYQPVLIDATYAGLISGAADSPLVIPALNRDGDCLSDLVMPMFGSIAGAESVLLAFDDDFKTTVAMAEAPHGTAPALQGKDIANPMAMILACGAVLHYAAEKGHAGAERASRAIYEAVLEATAARRAHPRPRRHGRHHGVHRRRHRARAHEARRLVLAGLDAVVGRHGRSSSTRPAGRPRASSRPSAASARPAARSPCRHRRRTFPL